MQGFSIKLLKSTIYAQIAAVFAFPLPKVEDEKPLMLIKRFKVIVTYPLLSNVRLTRIEDGKKIENFRQQRMGPQRGAIQQVLSIIPKPDLATGIYHV